MNSSIMGFLGLGGPQSLGTNPVPRSYRVTVTTTVKDLGTRLRPAIIYRLRGEERILTGDHQQRLGGR